MISLRCNLCDTYLSIWKITPFSCHLCENCYNIRCIIKAYDAKTIYKHLQTQFLIKKKEDEIIDKLTNNLKEINLKS